MSRILIPRRPVQLMFTATMLAVLAACGGGGGGDSTPTPTPAAPTWATSGFYSTVLRPQGTTAAAQLTVALSLVHPSNPAAEYVIDSTATLPTILGSVLQQGTYNSTTKRYTDLTPVAYVDGILTSVRTTSLIANGQRPAQATAAAITPLCSDSIEAKNYTAAFSSQIAVLSAGNDRVCGTSDDTQSLVTFSAAGAPTVATITLGKMLSYLRSATTGQPTQWLVGTSSGQLFSQPIGAGSPTALTAIPVPQSTTPSTYVPLVNLSDTVLFTQNGQLRAVGTQGTTTTASNVLSTLSGPEGWMAAGFDANNVYAYLNSNAASSGTGTWRILAISRSTLTATTLATGIGSLLSAEAAPTLSQLYATVVNGATFTTLRTAAPSGAQSNYIAPTTSAASVVSPDASGFNLQFSVSTNTPSVITSSVSNSAGVNLFSLANGILYGGDQTFIDITSNTLPLTSVIFLSTAGSAGFAGSAITRFDPVAVSSRSLGVVPTGAALGGVVTDPVFVTPLTPTNGFGGVSISRTTSNLFQVTTGGVYTYNTSTANSLTRTTVQVR